MSNLRIGIVRTVECTGHGVTISTITVTLLTCGTHAVVIIMMGMRMKMRDDDRHFDTDSDSGETSLLIVSEMWRGRDESHRGK